MPAHTQTRRAEGRHTDRQTSADNTALGFGPPEFSCLPVAGLPYRMAATVHQTWGRERNFPSHRISCLPERPLASALRRLECLIRSPFIGRTFCRVGCLPARPLASALRRLERLIRSHLYRKLSSAPDTFLLPSRASDLHWTFLSCLSTSAIIYLSPLSCKCSFLLVKGSQMRPQMFFPMSESLSGKREGFQDNATCKREVYC